MVGPTGIRTSIFIFAIFLIAAAVALWAASGEDIWQQITRLTPLEIGALLSLSLGNYVLRALRWMLYTIALGAHTGLIQTLRHYFGGFAMTMTPAKIGEVVRLRWIARETGARLENLAPLVLVDRAGDLASTGLLLAIALAFGATGITGGLPVAILALIAALIATRPALFAAVTNATYGLIRRKPRLFVRARRAARALAPFSNPAILIPALTLGGLGWFAEGFAFYLLLDWMGAGVPMWTAVSIFLFSMMTGGATGTPGGVGGAEAAMLALLSIQGVPLEISIPATAIIRITTLWFAIGLGVIIFPFAEGIATRTSHALENR
jgi:glycosyltransferase 2 family protein